MSEQLEAEQRARLAAEEMLGFVLLALGEPVVVPKELLTKGVPDGAQIKIDEDLQREAFVFSVEVPE